MKDQICQHEYNYRVKSFHSGLGNSLSEHILSLVEWIVL